MIMKDYGANERYEKNYTKTDKKTKNMKSITYSIIFLSTIFILSCKGDDENKEGAKQDPWTEGINQRLADLEKHLDNLP